jgi:hypothetical protein
MQSSEGRRANKSFSFSRRAPGVSWKTHRGLALACTNQGRHVEHSSLKKQHARAFRLANAAIKQRNERDGVNEKGASPLGAVHVPAYLPHSARQVGV